MSTRGIIGVYTNADHTHWRGVYHHFDSYPKGLGKALWDAAQTVWKNDLSGMLHFLIDEHPAGWSNIVCCDLTLKPVWLDSAARTETLAPLSYTVRGEDPYIWSPTDDIGWLDWAYLFDVPKQTMDIHKIPFNGLRYIATADLCGSEPDWQELQRIGYGQ